MGHGASVHFDATGHYTVTDASGKTVFDLREEEKNASIMKSMDASCSHAIPEPPLYSVPVGEADLNCTRTRRHVNAVDKLLVTKFEEVVTLYDAFQRGLRVAADKPCMGFRPKDEKGDYQAYKWYAYKEIAIRRDNFASGLVNLNLVPPAADGLKIIGHFCKNRMEWNISEHACNSQGFIVVPMYDTLGPEVVEFILNQTGAASILITSEEFDRTILIASKCKKFKNIILIDGMTDLKRNQAKEVGLNLLSFEEVEEKGAASPVSHNPPKAKDPATFCYTSGTTGNPKGAVLTSEELLGSCSAVVSNSLNMVDAEEYHLSYLPLAHIFERTIQLGIWIHGGAIGYYQGNTLKLMEDVAHLRPTVFPSVPRLYNKIYDKVVQGMEKAGGAKKAMFDNGMAAKTYWIKRGHNKNPFWDEFFFDKLKNSMGFDRIKYMITGSAPIADHVMEFFRCVFSCEVLEGYGQTETCAAATLTFPGDYTTGHVGGPIQSNEIKLESVPDMGYLATDTIHGEDKEAGKVGIACLGRGEICFRGTNVFKGYFQEPGKTKEAIDDKGWLHSGDIGIWLPNGAIKIVDRKKNIFKLSQGEYIAAEKLEIIYQSSPFVGQPFVYGDSLQSVIVGIIVPNSDFVLPWAAAHGMSQDMSVLCNDPEFKKIVLADIVRVAKEAKLNSIEIVKDIYLEPELWTPDDSRSILTPTFKLKRNDAKKWYLSKINEMYTKVGGITST